MKGETISANFWQGKCNFIANFSAIMVTSLPSHYFRLTLSLSLSPIVPHAQYRKRFRASYNKTKQTNKEKSTSSPARHTSGDRAQLLDLQPRTGRSCPLSYSNPVYASHLFFSLPQISHPLKTVLHYSYSHVNVHAVSTLVSR